jgi:dTDP-4-dehydrorhamnose reductase
MLGRAFTEAASTVRGCRVVPLDRSALDVTDRAAVLRYRGEQPDVIIHCAADVDADRCERNPEKCRRVQVEGTDHVIALARAAGARVVYPQTVFIFDGSELPVSETTQPAPLSVYGRYKLEAERCLLDALPGSLVVRMAGFFGGEERDKNFVGSFTRELLSQVRRGEFQCRVGERVWQPTYTRDLASNVLLLIVGGGSGVYNMGAYGEATFYEVASACVEDLHLGDLVSLEKAAGDAGRGRESAPRPFRMVTANRRLAAEGLDRQRHWRDALREYLSQPYFQQQARAVAP